MSAMTGYKQSPLAGLGQLLAGYVQYQQYKRNMEQRKKAYAAYQKFIETQGKEQESQMSQVLETLHQGGLGSLQSANPIPNTMMGSTFGQSSNMMTPNLQMPTQNSMTGLGSVLPQLNNPMMPSGTSVNPANSLLTSMGIV